MARRQETVHTGFASTLALARRQNELAGDLMKSAGETLHDSAGAGIEFAWPAGHPSSTSGDGSAHDLHLVQQLLERCWREIDASELNVKLTDLVRLLELKGKLSPQAGAEQTFWSLIDQMRHEHLADFGDPPPPALPAEDTEEPR